MRAELNTYCELHSCLVDPAVLAAKPLKGIIFSGGPASVYEEGSPHVHEGIFRLAEERGLPILGICYGLQEIVRGSAGEAGETSEDGDESREPRQGRAAPSREARVGRIECHPSA